jgi:competence protein ComEA
MIRNFIALLLAVFALSAFAAVDVNQASQAELETIKGIGPGLSAKILAARQSSSFKNWSDLVERVSGVGPGNAARFSQAGLTVAGSAYEGQAAAPKAARSAKATKADKTDKAGKPANARKAPNADARAA